jgi:endonuclease III
MKQKQKYQKIIDNMEEDEFELNEKTKREIEEAKKQVKAGNFYTNEEAKEILGIKRMNSKLAITQLKQIKKLVEHREDVRLAADWSEKWKVLISTILSSQTKDETTISVSNNLYKKYNSLRNLSKANIKDVKKIIRPVNYHKTKAKHILQTSKILVNTYSCKIPSDRERLLELPGVGRKVANVYLAVQGHQTIGVDTHITFLAQELGWTKNKHPHKIEKDLEELFPKKYRGSINYILVRFGRIYNKKKKQVEKLKEEGVI